MVRARVLCLLGILAVSTALWADKDKDITLSVLGTYASGIFTGAEKQSQTRRGGPCGVCRVRVHAGGDWAGCFASSVGCLPMDSTGGAARQKQVRPIEDSHAKNKI